MRKVKQLKITLALIIAFALSLASATAAASFQVTSFSCSPSESAINTFFSCTAQIENVGDASGSVSTATLYTDTEDWLEESNYPQASGTTVSPGQSTEVTFNGLKAIKSGTNGFSKIMLDSVTDTYVDDNNIEVNIINVAVSISNTASSAAMGETIDTTAEVTAGGNIDVILTLSITSGGCSIGDQSSQKTISGMQEGNTQSRTWTITQGTSGSCRFSISAAATGTGGAASKTDSSSSTITCTDCPVQVSGNTNDGDGSAASSGGGGGITSLGELITPQTTELSQGEKVKLNISNKEYSILITKLTETTAEIYIPILNKTFPFSIGQEKNFDLNNDNIADLSITLKTINILTNKATLLLARSGQSAIPETEGTKQEQTNEEKAGQFVEKFKVPLIIIAIAIIIAIGFVIVSFIQTKKLIEWKKIGDFAKRVNVKEFQSGT